VDSRAPDVSVIIPTHNRRALMEEAVRSVLAVSAPDIAVEVLVIDDSSEDGSAAAATRLGARVLTSSRPGAGAGRNVGVRAARAPIIAFLDDDDIWLEGHIRPQLRILRARSEFGAVVGQAVNADEALSTVGSPWPADLPRNGDLAEEFLRYSPQIGATVVRAAAFREAGLFDERLIDGQDWDWHLRLAHAVPVGFVPVPCVLFRQRPAGDADWLLWRRLGNMTQVFAADVRRERPGPGAWPRLARTYAARRGGFYADFCKSAQAHRAAGNTRALAGAVRYAMAASPAHALRGIARPAELGGPLRQLLFGAWAALSS
jgi:glycosyltransferase involved in cell wall biosynthesis